jgi:hypothetical protein
MRGRTRGFTESGCLRVWPHLSGRNRRLANSTRERRALFEDFDFSLPGSDRRRDRNLSGNIATVDIGDVFSANFRNQLFDALGVWVEIRPAYLAGNGAIQLDPKSRTNGLLRQICKKDAASGGVEHRKRATKTNCGIRK